LPRFSRPQGAAFIFLAVFIFIERHSGPLLVTVAVPFGVILPVVAPGFGGLIGSAGCGFEGKGFNRLAAAKLEPAFKKIE
jgi:hypothetical protein